MDNRTLIDNIAAETGMGREKVQEMLGSFYGIAAECCVAMDTIIIPGFGQFEPKKRKERLAVHPSTGRRLLVPPKLVMGFRPSAVMKSAISNQDLS
ncbi:MAG: HU family DNA-binding protein [Muribaculaceae bacterium]|nr:HU family DNA-binding protein [Muribaculaceae bacterium]MDE7081028.1 HU family DNA-binding protein [Muribaculaceae bacterium]